MSHTELGEWLYFNSSTIQAVCSILALIGLGIYAWDTRRIRQATLSQSEASRRPYFTLERYEDNQEIRLKNVGSGIALEFRWRYGNKAPTKEVPPSAVAVDGIIHPLDPDWNTRPNLGHVRTQGIYITYTDTAGKAYWSRFDMVDGHVRIQTGEL